ncbi:hypothetical protein [Pseudomonas mangiferae]|uniref:DUF1652 domain-containing protein n=1 Tax=Pseudomonas mangiferae TaxID=2593654 RepID=A0A553H2F3_9PSED|nr:hypothetical protein [Pseudomonas mangiferae]TRX75913.1 hypothetical protein FM069_05615 [Pseudomonas mangiferae]
MHRLTAKIRSALPSDTPFALDVHDEVIELTISDPASSSVISRLLYQRHLENRGLLDTLVNDIQAELLRNRCGTY